MATEPTRLVALPIPGLRPDSLGNYLASLGLLRIVARRWPNLRAAWRDGVFQLVGGPAAMDDVLGVLGKIAAKREWTPYQRQWAEAQKRSTKAKLSLPLALWQASTDERDLELAAAHVVPSTRLSFNPLLGSGGNAGKRDFSKGWKLATDALAEPEPSTDTREHLKALLLGEPVTWMIEKLNAACWFSDSNKLFNSGQRPFREGLVSPWAMVLACEGLVFFAGGASRRLGARARAFGAFPFVTGAAAPLASGEAGRDRGEVWAPIWERPTTMREVVTLFSRGRAEVGGRGVLTPSAFATAVVRRGVDAGITEFRRFVLGRTTSSNTFEPRFEGPLRVRMFGQSSLGATAPSETNASSAFECLLALCQQLPRDRKVGKRWRFLGLRGPLEAAMVHAAAARSDPEDVHAMLDAAVTALDRVDRNRTFRKHRIAWRPLPLLWLPEVFGSEAPCVEARLALAAVSSFPVDRPFTLYRFGVELEHGRRFVHPERTPKQWVWRPGVALPRALEEVICRSTVDWEAAADHEEPRWLVVPAGSAHVERWLLAEIDDELLSRWLSRLALFDWRVVPRAVRSLARPAGGLPGATAPLCLFGLFQPLFDLRPIPARQGEPRQNWLPPESGARAPAVCRALANLLRVGRVSAALRLASSRFALAGTSIMETNVPWTTGDPERLLASLLFAVFDNERAALLKRWLRPYRGQGELAYA